MALADEANVQAALSKQMQRDHSLLPASQRIFDQSFGLTEELEQLPESDVVRIPALEEWLENAEAMKQQHLQAAQQASVSAQNYAAMMTSQPFVHQVMQMVHNAHQTHVQQGAAPATVPTTLVAQPVPQPGLVQAVNNTGTSALAQPPAPRPGVQSTPEYHQGHIADHTQRRVVSHIVYHSFGDTASEHHEYVSRLVDRVLQSPNFQNTTLARVAMLYAQARFVQHGHEAMANFLQQQIHEVQAGLEQGRDFSITPFAAPTPQPWFGNNSSRDEEEDQSYLQQRGFR